MTSKDEQEELAKQKVRDAHPSAFRSAKGTVWSERGMTKIRLGTTWQNAAESLQAKVDIDTCAGCGEGNEWCKCNREEPAAPSEPLPVEGEDKPHVWVPNVLSDWGGDVCRNCGLVKEAYDGKHPCRPSSTFQGIPGYSRDIPKPKPQGGDYRPHYRKDETDAYIAQVEYERDVWRDKCKMLTKAEPKPTPSAPEINLRRDAHPDYLFSLYMRMANAHAEEGWLGVTKVYVAEKAEMEKRFAHLKPQPDSSSIPCVGCEGRPVAPNDPCAVCGSSSITDADLNWARKQLPYKYQELYEGKARQIASLIASGDAGSIDKVARLLAMEDEGRSPSSVNTDQTFEEWKKAYFDSPEFLMTDTCEEVAWAAWNAAKESK